MLRCAIPNFLQKNEFWVTTSKIKLLRMHDNLVFFGVRHHNNQHNRNWVLVKAITEETNGIKLANHLARETKRKKYNKIP